MKIYLLKLFIAVCLIATALHLKHSPGQAQQSPAFVKLATYWDAPGIVKEISPRGDFIVITDRATGQTRLVETATGHILTEQSRDDVIYFSPDGRYASVYDVASGSTQLLDMQPREITYEAHTGIILIRFSADSQRGQVNFHHENRGDHTQVIAVESGEILIDVPGINAQLSPDGRFIAIADPQTYAVSVYAVDSGEIMLEWPLIEDGEGRVSASSVFSPDSSLLVIYHPHNFTGHVFEVSTWEKIYEITGYPVFGANSGYIISNRHATYSHVYLYEAATGVLLDEVDGDMYFNVEGTLVFRREARAPGDRGGTIRVIELASGTTLFEASSEGYDTINVSVQENNTLARVYKQIFDINYVPVTTYFDLDTGEVVKEITGNAKLVEAERGLLIVDSMIRQGQPAQKLVDWDSGETYITERWIDVSPDGRYIATSNGLFVDVYGTPEERRNTMPPPRPTSGIGMAEPGDIPVYPQPDTAVPLIESTLNPLVFSVMGKSADGNWLYGTYLLDEHREGWMQPDLLTVVEPWDDVPVLAPLNPLATLYQIAVND